MTPELICKNCRFGTPAVGSSNETVCHRRSSTRYTFMYNHWCAEGEWKNEYGWASWYDIMDMEEAVTEELERGQGETRYNKEFECTDCNKCVPEKKWNDLKDWLMAQRRCNMLQMSVIEHYGWVLEKMLRMEKG